VTVRVKADRVLVTSREELAKEFSQMSALTKVAAESKDIVDNDITCMFGGKFRDYVHRHERVKVSTCDGQRIDTWVSSG
jgi:hypothetical protein